MSNPSNKTANVDHTPMIIDVKEKIRQRVDDRHWQLFEARLKQQLPDTNKENNYTNTNDYRVIDRLRKFDQPQTPVEPNRRWESFCQNLTTKSNETNRLMSIFQHVWQTNWNVKPTDDKPKRHTTDPNINQSIFYDQLSINDSDRKKISSILHRASSTENVPSNKVKKNLI